jgi:hypothetical protein
VESAAGCREDLPGGGDGTYSGGADGTIGLKETRQINLTFRTLARSELALLPKRMAADTRAP